jgi:hypothetical protein
LVTSFAQTSAFRIGRSTARDLAACPRDRTSPGRVDRPPMGRHRRRLCAHRSSGPSAPGRRTVACLRARDDEEPPSTAHPIRCYDRRSAQTLEGRAGIGTSGLRRRVEARWRARQRSALDRDRARRCSSASGHLAPTLEGSREGRRRDADRPARSPAHPRRALARWRRAARRRFPPARPRIYRNHRGRVRTPRRRCCSDGRRGSWGNLGETGLVLTIPRSSGGEDRCR